MGKVVGVYLNKGELQRLQELGKELGLEGETAIVKTALNHLATAQNGHNNSEPTVKITPQENLKAEVREGFKEFNEDNKRKAEADAKAREQKEKDDKSTEVWLNAMGFSN